MGRRTAATPSALTLTPGDPALAEPVERSCGGRRSTSGVQVVPASPSTAASAEARGRGTAVDEPVASDGWSCCSSVGQRGPGARHRAQRRVVRRRRREGHDPVAARRLLGAPRRAPRRTHAAVDHGAARSARPASARSRTASGLPQASGTSGSTSGAAHRHSRHVDLGEREALPVLATRPRPGSTRRLVVPGPDRSWCRRARASTASLTPARSLDPDDARPRRAPGGDRDRRRRRAARRGRAATTASPASRRTAHAVSSGRRRRRRTGSCAGLGAAQRVGVGQRRGRRQALAADVAGRGRPAVDRRRAGSPRTGCRTGGAGLRASTSAELPSWTRPKKRSRSRSPSVRTTGPSGVGVGVGVRGEPRRLGPSSPGSARSSRSSGPPTTTGSALRRVDGAARARRPRRSRSPGTGVLPAAVDHDRRPPVARGARRRRRRARSVADPAQARRVGQRLVHQRPGRARRDRAARSLRTTRWLTPARRRYAASPGDPCPARAARSIASSIRMLPGGASGMALRTAQRRVRERTATARRAARPRRSRRSASPGTSSAAVPSGRARQPVARPAASSRGRPETGARRRDPAGERGDAGADHGDQRRCRRAPAWVRRRSVRRADVDACRPRRAARPQRVEQPRRGRAPAAAG